MRVCLIFTIILVSIQGQAYLSGAAIKTNCKDSLRIGVDMHDRLPPMLKVQAMASLASVAFLKNPKRWAVIETLGDLQEYLQIKRSHVLKKNKLIEDAFYQQLVDTSLRPMEHAQRISDLQTAMDNSKRYISEIDDALAKIARRSEGMSGRLDARFNNALSMPEAQSLHIGDLKKDLDREIKSIDGKLGKYVIEEVTPDGTRYLPKITMTASELEEVSELAHRRSVLKKAYSHFEIHNFYKGQTMVEVLQQMTARGKPTGEYQKGLQEAAELILRGRVLATGKTFLGPSAKILLKGAGTTLGIAIAAFFELTGILHLADGVAAAGADTNKELYISDPATMFQHLKDGRATYEQVCDWANQDLSFNSVVNASIESISFASGKPPPLAILSTNIFKDHSPPEQRPVVPGGRGVGPGPLSQPRGETRTSH